MFASLFLAGVLVAVEGAAGCPSSSLVSERLAALLPESDPGGGAPDRALISVHGGALEIELRDAAGALVGTRRIDEDAPCADLAAASAVVIATWEATQKPGSVPPPSLLSLGPPARIHLDFGAGLALGIAGGGSTFGPTVEVGLAGRSGRGRGLGLRLAIVYPLLQPHTVDLPTAGGHAEWTRRALSLGPRYRFAPGLLRFDLHLGPALAWVVVDGVSPGSWRARSDNGVALGADLGFRAGLDLGAAIVWAGAALFWYFYPTHPRAQVLDGATGASLATADLPSLELVLSVGVAFGVGR